MGIKNYIILKRTEDFDTKDLLIEDINKTASIFDAQVIIKEKEKDLKEFPCYLKNQKMIRISKFIFQCCECGSPHETERLFHRLIKSTLLSCKNCHERMRNGNIRANG